MPTINRPLSVIREMTIDAMRDYEEHTKQEVVEIIEKKSETQLSKIEKGYVSTVLRTYAGIFKSFREHRPIVFKLSQAQQHNVVLKTRMQVKLCQKPKIPACLPFRFSKTGCGQRAQ